MGVYIKNLVINEISGGIVHFGNTRTISPISASKSAENGNGGSQAQSGGSQSMGAAPNGGQMGANQTGPAGQSTVNPAGGG
ncbi:hypothetical protein GKZ89_00350 [Bacillus mangrovi]|uniref:Spore germination protein n=1 Tax=Metabacillus mangrovi TaxID=1491830 RepID=A0A7X2V247_9BACI|nr:spore germination protein [Metabacillus mangrovi]MTH51837.1 hypothetical protein [Metabacillus mangrovi]